MRSILVGTELGRGADVALRCAGHLAQGCGAALHAVHGMRVVGLPLREALPRLQPAWSEQAAATLGDQLRAACAPTPVEPATCHADWRAPLDAVLHRCRELRPDLVVLDPDSVASGGGPGLAELILLAGCPVLVARGARSAFTRVLVPMGPRDLAAETLSAACAWLEAASPGGAPGERTEMHVIHVSPRLGEWREFAPALDEAVRVADDQSRRIGTFHRHVRWAARAAPLILETAAYEEVDLLVMRPGALPSRGAEERTWEALAMQARCSVLLLPASYRPGAPTGAGRSHVPDREEPLLALV